MSTRANQSQADAWNGDSGHRWAAGADGRDRVLAPVGEVLLDRAAITEDDHVVDIGCGCGATTLAAGRLCASAQGLDLSGPMLQVARRRAADVGRTNVQFVEGDAQAHAFEPATVTVAISRFGTMFFDNPVAAFANIGTALAPQGRLCIATWQPLASNGWLIIPGAVLLQYAELPAEEPGAPGMFAQSDPDVLVDLLGAAGFQDVAPEKVEVTFNLGATAGEAAAYLAESGPGRALLETIADETTRNEAIAGVTAELTRHRTAEGIRLGGGILITTARWPG